MPNPVAVNDLSPISGSLQTSRISYGVDLIGKNYGQNYNGTKWYSDIPNDGTYYTIVSDNYTANYYISRSLAGGAYVEGGQPAVDDFSAPVFWTTQGTSSADIIAVVNGLPDRKGQTPFTTGEQALDWVASSNNYFAIGPDYFKQIEGDQLQLFYNANQIISYPTTSSKWYDISGHNNEGLIENGTSFNTEGWFDFDGVDDLISTNWNKNGDLTYEGVFYLQPSDSGYSGFFGNMYSPTGYSANGSGWIVRLNPSNQLEIYIRNNNVAGSRTILINNFRTTYSGQWIHLSFIIESGGANRLYVNNNVVNGSSYVMGEIQPSAELLIGAYDWGGRVETYYLRGSNQYTKSYSKSLTEAEVLQNYYGGPIVTDGLVFHVDANKLVSYSTTTGPEWFDMSNTMQPTQLLNGITWSPENGGVFTFDGVDDIGVNSDPLFEIPENVTINAWIKESNLGSSLGNYMAKANNSGYRMRRQGGNGSTLWIYSSGNSISGGNIYDDVWHMVTGVFSDIGLRAYIDGELVASNSTPYTPANLSLNDMFLGGYSPGSELFGGEMAMAQTYNRALSTQEIQQIYNATK